MKENYNQINFELYQMYLNSNKARNFETLKTTYKVYESNMKQYMKYLQKYEGNRLLLSEGTIKNCVSILERYINHCRQLGNNNQTINNKLTAISSFYIWCVKRDLISHHPFMHKLDRLKKGTFDRRRKDIFLSVEDVIKARVLMQHNPKKFDIQSQLLWDLFLESGNRISCLQRLKMSQLNLKEGYFENALEKGRKVVDVIFFDKTEKLLYDWISERKLKKIDEDTDFLFVTKYKNKYKQMEQSTFRKRLKKIGSLIDYENIYPHALRKSALNLLTNMSGDINMTADFANHNDIKTTKEHYTKKKTAQENRAKIKQLYKEKGIL